MMTKPASIPPQSLFMAKAYIHRNPGVLATRARYGIERTFGLDSSDPIVLCAFLAGIFYVDTLAATATEAGTINEQDAAAVSLITKAAGNHAVGALVEVGAMPQPQAWIDEMTEAN